MRHADAPAGAAMGQGRADTRAGAPEGAEGAPCGLCGGAPPARRGLCWTCYRKLRQHGLLAQHPPSLRRAAKDARTLLLVLLRAAVARLEAS